MAAFADLYPAHMTTTMTAVEFTAFLVLATAMSFTPGPNTTMAATMGANWGLKPTMRFVWGVPVGWCALLLLCASGVGALVMAAPVMKTAIKALGIAYLCAPVSGNAKVAKAGKLPADGRGLSGDFFSPTACAPGKRLIQ